MKKTNKFPAGWDESRVQKVIKHYESQTEDEAVAEDESILKGSRTVMKIPSKLVPEVRRMIARNAKALRRA